jgi:phosphotriesterase-related protein
MDRYGLDIFLPTDKRNATVIELCKRGHANRMTLSQDACATMDWYPPELKPQLAPEWDFTFLWRGVLPALSDGGVSDDEIDTMMRQNPRAWLTA